MRILVTNDDGVHAPGLNALAAALERWAGDDHEVVVVAPLANHSGAAAAVGTVYERTALTCERVRLPGARAVPAFGVDASPALAVLAGALGGFGPRPDVVVSGINLGVNVGRSILHSGTVGATLAGAQLGLRGLAVSLRAGSPTPPWATATTVALAVLPALLEGPAATVLNLNVPSLSLRDLRGVRHARISTAGIVKGATPGPTGPPGEPGAEGEILLARGSAIPSLGPAEGTPGQEDDDATSIAAGYATLTPIVGVREDTAPAAGEVVTSALDAIAELLAR